MTTKVYNSARCGDATALRKALMKHKTHIDNRNRYDRDFTPLHIAAANGQRTAVEVLIEFGTKAATWGDSTMDYSPAHLAATNGHADVIDVLIRLLGSDVVEQRDKYGWRPIHYAAKKNHLNVVMRLATLGPSVLDVRTDNDQTPLYLAAYKGNAAIVWALIEHGSQFVDLPDKTGTTPLHAAARRGHVGAIEALLWLGSQALETSTNWTPMHIAVKFDNASAVETIVRRGGTAILEKTSTSGRTPISSVGLAKLSAGDKAAKATLKTLLALGARTDVRQLEKDKREQFATVTVSEEERLEARFRVYFAGSLVDRLLFSLSRHQVLRHTEAQRRD